MTLLADRLVGRAEELGSLDQVLAELDRGSAAAIELVGEPGIGKTRLLAELAARADARGHLVLSGSASELERDLPFSVFVDALDEYVEGLDPRRLEALDDDVQAELAHVFPSLSALAGGREVAFQHERYRTHRAVRASVRHPRPGNLTSNDVTSKVDRPSTRMSPRRGSVFASPTRGLSEPASAEVGSGWAPRRSSFADRFSSPLASPRVLARSRASYGSMTSTRRPASARRSQTLRGAGKSSASRTRCSCAIHWNG